MTPIKLLLTALGACLSPLLLSAATVTISIVRIDIPDAVWSEYRSALGQYEQVLEQTDGDFTYAVRSDEESIDFIYDFPHGWDWHFTETWRRETIPALNASLEEAGAGWRWQVTVDGEISEGSNPWTEVNWLEDVDVVNGEYLRARGLGWLYARNWSTDGNFWAYPYDLMLGWLYVHVAGYYYSLETGGWLLNYPGTAWFYDYMEEQWIRGSEPEDAEQR